MAEQKYNVSYSKANSFSGHTMDAENIQEVMDILEERRFDYYLFISVYDRVIDKHIFWKDALCSKASVDYIWNRDRDLRTKTRLAI